MFLRLQRAIEEERYRDAAHIRDHAGAGLVSIAKTLQSVIFLLVHYMVATTNCLIFTTCHLS